MEINDGHLLCVKCTKSLSLENRKNISRDAKKQAFVTMAEAYSQNKERLLSDLGHETTYSIKSMTFETAVEK